MELQIESVPWAANGHYLSSRPAFTFDPLFHAGCYYVQEASGMFLEQALKQTVDLKMKLNVLDVCASPGGKTTHLQSLISSESILVSNEVIKSRSAILKENVLRWSGGNTIVTSNDPADLGKLSGFFDIMVVDAPCSGSGLFRKDEEAIPFWSPAQVEHCSLRQKRILTDAWPALKKDGMLIYCTCSFSREEDEEILNWLSSQFSVSPVRLDLNKDWNIVETQSQSGSWGYRFWPDKLKGEGFFLACFRRSDETEIVKIRNRKKNEVLTGKEEMIIGQWITNESIKCLKQDKQVLAIPKWLETEFDFIHQQLKVIYSGIIVGEMAHDKLIPNHSLAMSRWTNSSVPKIELGYDASIAYLQRREGVTHPGSTGWKLATYDHQPLGWMNVLPNRINNYYPKEMRILKDR